MLQQNHKKKDKLLGLIADANADNWEGIHPNTKNADLPEYRTYCHR